MLLAVVWAGACGGENGTGPELPPPPPNRPPVVSGSIADQTLTVGDSVTVNAASLFTDPDGDALTYTATSSAPGTAGVAVSGATVTVTAVRAGTATITVTARDPGGLSATASGNVTVEEPNRPPVVSGSIADQTLTVGDSVTVNAASLFADPDGDALTYTATSSAPGTAGVAVSGTTVTVTAVRAGTATITVTARDPGGLSATASGNVTVEEPNRPPVVSGSIADQTLTVGDSVAVNAASLFTDPDGDSLTYTATSSAPGTAGVAVSGTTVTVTAVGAGTATITVTARDPGGLSAAVSGNVTVEEPNRPPVAVLPMLPGQTAQLGNTITQDVSAFFSDPDGDPLSYSATSSNTSVATVSVTGSVVSGAAVGVGSTTLTATATDPGGLSASITFDVTVIPAASTIFWDDFDDDGGLSNSWSLDNAEAVVSEGVVQLTNTADTQWGIGARPLGRPVTYWEVLTRLGRQSDGVQTALSFVAANPGDLTAEVFRILIGTRILDFGGGDTETVNYALQVFFQPEGRELDWYYISDDDVAFRGMSDAINDGPGEFTDITVRAQGGRFEALAGTETLFSTSSAGLTFGAALTAITEVHLWTYDEALTSASLLDWIEVNGVRTTSSSANADGEYNLRPVPSSTRDMRAVREASAIVHEVPAQVCVIRNCR